MSERENAKKNLEMAGLLDKDSDYGGMIGEAVLKLIDTHFDEGQCESCQKDHEEYVKTASGEYE